MADAAARHEAGAFAGGARVVGSGLLVYAAMAFAGAYLASYAIAARAAQAVIAEWGMGRLGVAWTDPDVPEQPAAVIARRAGVGALCGAGGAAFVILFTVVTGAARVAALGVGVEPLIVGLVPAALVAVQNELLLRGLVLRVMGPRTLDTSARRAQYVGACAVVAVAHAYGEGSANGALVGAGLLGASLAALWTIDRGAWMAWGARTAWLWMTGPVVRGGVLDVRSAATAWGGGDLGPTAGWAGIVATLGLTGVACAIALRGVARDRTRSPA
jgi:hypothetical protein